MEEELLYCLEECSASEIETCPILYYVYIWTTTCTVTVTIHVGYTPVFERFMWCNIIWKKTHKLQKISCEVKNGYVHFTIITKMASSLNVEFNLLQSCIFIVIVIAHPQLNVV